MHGLALIVIVTILLVAPGRAASQGLGRIEARIGDTDMRWQTITTARTRGTEASAAIRFGPRLTEIQIQGYPGAEFTSSDAISVDVRYLGPYAPDAVPMSVDILYMPEGMGGPFWTSNGATIAPTVRVLALDVWGAFGRIDLLFAGELCLRMIISAATDPGRCQEVTGRIETDLFVDYGMPGGTRRP
jgi:hypothetical protein